MLELDRRRFLMHAIAALGIAATRRIDTLAAFAQAPVAGSPKRIDGHHHFAPPAWVAEGKGRQLLQAANTAWTPAKSIEDMDRGVVRRAVRAVRAAAW